MRAGLRLGMLAFAVGLWLGSPALARGTGQSTGQSTSQSPPPTPTQTAPRSAPPPATNAPAGTVGPRELQNFSLGGTATQPAETSPPPATAPANSDAVGRPVAHRRRSLAADAPVVGISAAGAQSRRRSTTRDFAPAIASGNRPQCRSLTAAGVGFAVHYGPANERTAALAGARDGDPRSSGKPSLVAAAMAARRCRARRGHWIPLVAPAAERGTGRRTGLRGRSASCAARAGAGPSESGCA